MGGTQQRDKKQSKRMENFTEESMDNETRGRPIGLGREIRFAEKRIETNQQHGKYSTTNQDPVAIYNVLLMWSLVCGQVFRYNLIVPFGRQMFGLKWEKEIDLLKD